MTRSRSPGNDIAGTQTLERAVHLLRTLATGPRPGWRLTDLARHCGFDTGTTHRILKRLVAERLVERDAERRYLPGPLLCELGLSHRRPMALVDAARPGLAALAAEFGAVGMLWLRSGADVVCAARVGRARTEVFVDVGTRRPLASMAPGLSILLGLKPAQRRTLIAENMRRIATLFPDREAAFRAMIRRSERAGFGLTVDDVVDGLYAIGAALAAPGDAPVAALALVGRTSDLPGGTPDAVAARLRAVATQVEQRCADALARMA